MTKNNKVLLIGTAIFITVSIQFIIIGFSDNLFLHNDYNSFTRQALAWLEGRLDLGEDVTWLELAIYNGKYYVSFPPFPSFIMLPFAFFMGLDTPDYLLTVLVMIVGVIYASRIAISQNLSKYFVVFLPVLLYSASAVLQITIDSGVWFFAQNCSFTFTLMSLYYMINKRKGKTIFFLCCAFGCRPFQIVILPFILYYFYKNSPENNFLGKTKKLFFEKFYVFIPTIILSCLYMGLNYLRFGSPFEFGHNYLPEFTNSENGQFSIYYIFENFGNLFRLPGIIENFKFDIPIFNGMNIFISFPILIFFAYLIFKKIFDKIQIDKLIFLILITTCVHTLFFLCHKTMGGFHFGNRYIADTLPLVYFGTCLLLKNNIKKDYDKIIFEVLLLLGLVFNSIGIYWIYI